MLDQCKLEFPKIRAGLYQRSDLVRIGGLAPAGFWIDWLRWGEFSEVMQRDVSF